MTPRARPSFAAIGHQEDWERLAAIVNGWRGPALPAAETSDLKALLPYIPPRTISRFRLGAEARGVEAVYIDAMIDPDTLAAGAPRSVGRRVEAALGAASREGAKIATLGGFTSILFEAARAASAPIAVTTGNSLTAALIVKGVERACALLGRALGESEVLVIGATGDVGSAVCRGLATKVDRLALAARHRGRLDALAASLGEAVDIAVVNDFTDALGTADIVVAVASSGPFAFDVAACREGAIVCDAGYPKNMRPDAGGTRRLFWGGIGQLDGGFPSHDGLLETFYRFPLEGCAHGCILEGAALALAGRYENFSRGRGSITTSRMDEIWDIARAQGIGLAPLFDANGVWPEECEGS